MSDSTITRKISLASVIMMASVFASRIIGLGREAVIAWAGGASAPVDAYQIAFVIPEILNHIAASGFLSITFIPIFARYISQNRHREGDAVFSTILNGFGVLLLGFVLITMVWAPELVRLLAPGLKDPDTLGLAVRMTRIIIPAQVFFFSGGLFMAVQFTHEKFLIPALAPLIYNLGIILGGIVLSPRLGMEGFAWGVLAGAFFGSFFLQWIGARKTGLRYSLTFQFRHPDFTRYILLTLPLMVGLTMTFSTEILLKFFGSFLDPGRISAMNYAIRVLFILVGFFGQAVGTASYPFMARIAATGDLLRLNEIINQTLKFIFIAIPFSVLFMVLRHEIVLVLFQRGRFDLEAARLTAGILPFFLAGTFAFSAQTIVSRGYFALQNTLFPAVFSTLCVGAGLPLIYLLMKIMGSTGVALGLSLSAALNTFLLFECWNRKTRNQGKKEVYLFFVKMVFLGLAAGGILFPVHRGLSRVIGPESILGALAISVLTGIVFLIFMPAAGRGLKIRQINDLMGKLVSRMAFRS